MRAAKAQASLCICADSPVPPLLDNVIRAKHLVCWLGGIVLVHREERASRLAKIRIHVLGNLVC